MLSSTATSLEKIDWPAGTCVKGKERERDERERERERERESRIRNPDRVGAAGREPSFSPGEAGQRGVARRGAALGGAQPPLGYSWHMSSRRERRSCAAYEERREGERLKKRRSPHISPCLPMSLHVSPYLPFRVSAPRRCFPRRASRWRRCRPMPPKEDRCGEVAAHPHMNMCMRMRMCMCMCMCMSADDVGASWRRAGDERRRGAVGGGGGQRRCAGRPLSDALWPLFPGGASASTCDSATTSAASAAASRGAAYPSDRS